MPTSGNTLCNELYKACLHFSHKMHKNMLNTTWEKIPMNLYSQDKWFIDQIIQKLQEHKKWFIYLITHWYKKNGCAITVLHRYTRLLENGGLYFKVLNKQWSVISLIKSSIIIFNSNDIYTLKDSNGRICKCPRGIFHLHFKPLSTQKGVMYDKGVA